MHRRKRISRLALAVTLLALPAALHQSAHAGSAPAPAASTAQGGTAGIPLEDLAVTTTQVASGLKRPTTIATPDDGSGRLFITEKAGTVRVYHPDSGLAAEPLLDLTGVVNGADNERGLLGLATAPDFADSQVLYVAYTRLSDNAVTLARVDLDGSAEPEELLTQEHARYSNHNGGQLAFGPDGHLYWAIGDGGGSGDPFLSGQSVDTLLGKILRLDVSRTCGDLPYCVPEDNPFADTGGARGEIWAYGLRNPWRFSFDSADGSLWIGDVGQGTEEEVDHLAPNEGGANFGWSCREGSVVFDETHCSDDADYTEPVFSYRSSVEGCSVIGGHVYHGKESADLLDGTYVFTDYCSSTVWALRPGADGDPYESAVIGATPTQVTSFGVDADGEFYVVNDLPGQLHRMSFEQKQNA